MDLQRLASAGANPAIRASTWTQIEAPHPALVVASDAQVAMGGEGRAGVYPPHVQELMDGRFHETTQESGEVIPRRMWTGRGGTGAGGGGGES